jgi:hypothetical protein
MEVNQLSFHHGGKLAQSENLKAATHPTVESLLYFTLFPRYSGHVSSKVDSSDRFLHFDQARPAFKAPGGLLKCQT